ncbi:MAG: MxaL protein [Gammaproteobacteria bacterium]
MKLLLGVIDADLRALALVVALALLGACLLRPELLLSRTLYRHLIVFDITQSMNVADVGEGPAERFDVNGVAIPYTRLDLAKHNVADLLEDYPCGSSVGLALFTGHRSFVLFTPVEVCRHYGELRQLVAAIDWRMGWEARSEIVKGVHSALSAAPASGPDTAIVVLTDGHEAPPLNPEYHPSFRGVPGEIAGLIAGMGGSVPVPIPKLDQYGRKMGYFAKDEVLQVDTYSLGRYTSVREALSGVASTSLQERIASGTEHLSSLREAHLRDLGAKLELHYARANDVNDLAEALFNPRLGFTREVSADIRWLLGLAALALLILAHARRPRRARQSALFTSWRT